MESIMTKAKYTELIGKYIELAFSYKPKKGSRNKYIKAFGEIKEVDEGGVKFVDNDNFPYEHITFNNIWECNVQDEPRRTKEEWQEILEKRVARKYNINLKAVKEIKENLNQ